MCAWHCSNNIACKLTHANTSSANARPLCCRSSPPPRRDLLLAENPVCLCMFVCVRAERLVVSFPFFGRLRSLSSPSCWDHTSIRGGGAHNPRCATWTREEKKTQQNKTTQSTFKDDPPKQKTTPPFPYHPQALKLPALPFAPLPPHTPCPPSLHLHAKWRAVRPCRLHALTSAPYTKQTHFL